MTRRWPALLAVALLAALAAAGWLARGRSAGVAPGPAASAAAAASAPARRFGGPNRVQPVSVAQVRRQDIRVTLPAIGNIAAANTAVVRARVDGELVALHFGEGERVRAGQLLAEIDPRAFRIALAQAEGQLARDRAQLDNARLDLERFRDLLARDAIARQQVDTQAALVHQLEGTLQADRAAVDNARLQLAWTRITAPIAGLAGLRQADLGNLVRAGDANGLLTIAQVQPAYVVFAVPEQHLSTIRRRLAADEPLAVEAWDRDQRQLLASGRVTNLDNAVDPATGTIRLKARFANDDGGLFPNQFVNVRLQLDVLRGVLAVPGAAIQRGAQGAFVCVVAADGSVALRRVTPGAGDGDRVAIAGDVHDGDTVVIDGADRLRDGAKVEVIAAPAGAAQAAGVAAAASGALPAWFDRLPPEVQRRLAAMSPDERRAWVRARQAERAAGPTPQR